MHKYQFLPSNKNINFSKFYIYFVVVGTKTQRTVWSVSIHVIPTRFVNDIRRDYGKTGTANAKTIHDIVIIIIIAFLMHRIPL